MVYRPVRLGSDVSPGDVFGAENEGASPLARAVIEESLQDGVVDGADFDRYLSCGDDGSCHFASRGAADEYAFLRIFYYHLRRSSGIDDYKDQLSRDEASEFRSWFASSDVFADARVKSKDVFGKSLHCSRKYDSHSPKGNCPPLDIGGNRLLMVVHPSFFFDGSGSARGPIDDLVDTALSDGIPVVYLIHQKKPFFDFYLHNMQPTHAVSSYSGEHVVSFHGNEVVLTGGYFGACLSIALNDLLSNRTGDGDMRIIMPADAVFVSEGFFLSFYPFGPPELITSKSLRKALARMKDPSKYLVDMLAVTFGAGEKQPPRFNVHLLYKGERYAIIRAGDSCPNVTVEID